jgi:hypothetical protein
MFLMKVSRLIPFCLLFVLLSLASNTFGQIIATNADKKVPAEYLTVDSVPDTIYVFNQYATAKKGVFTALNPRGGNAKFTWSRFNYTTYGFDTFRQDSDVPSSKLDTLTVGAGYRVTISKTPWDDTTFTFWFYPHRMSLKVLKNDDQELLYSKYDCNYIKLEVDTDRNTIFLDTFTYFSPDKHNPYILKNGLKFTWTADPAPTSSLYIREIVTLPVPPVKKKFRNNSPPSENTWYTLTVTDSLNYSTSDKVHYTSIIPKAKITKQDETKIKYPPQGSGGLSAPFVVTFTNDSKNAELYKWDMGDGTTRADTGTFTHTYIDSKKYIIKLIAYHTNTNSCSNSDSTDVTVDPPDYELPNVFIVGTSSNFKPANVSVGQFILLIYSRWGKEVYHESGMEMEKMNGWDGKIKGATATEGVYYYVLEMNTFTQNSTLSKPGKVGGFFYLYHQK